MSVTRVSFGSNQIAIRTQLRKSQARYNAKILPTTTGRSVNHLYDDSSRMSNIFNTRGEIQRNQQYQANINMARIKLEYAESRISLAKDVFDRARDIALTAQDPTLSGSLSNELESQINDLKTELLTYANASFGGRYIFSGSDSDTLPFSGTPTAFNGNNVAVDIQINASVSVQVNFDGEEVFSGAGGGIDVFGVLDDLATAIGNANQTDIATEIGNIDTVLEQFLNAIADSGARSQKINAIESGILDDKLRFTTQLSDLQDADIAESISDLVKEENALRLSFESSTRIVQFLAEIRSQF